MLTPEEITKARELSSPSIPDDDDTAKQPTRQLVRKMLAHIDEVTERYKNKVQWISPSAEERIKSANEALRAAIDRAEKAEFERNEWRSKWDIMTHNRNAEQVRAEKAEAELRKAKVEAEGLAKSIWQSEFQSVSPEWSLCDTVDGVISQIDNMYAGVRAQRDESRTKVAELKAIVDRFPKTADGVPIEVGNTLWFFNETDDHGMFIDSAKVTGFYKIQFKEYRGEVTVGLNGDWEGGNLETYSTREAALAAKQEGKAK